MSRFKVCLAELAPVWLQRAATIDKVVTHVARAGQQGAGLIVFGEAFVPRGYPFWLELTEGARFDSRLQKELFAHYTEQAVQLEAGHLDPVCKAAREAGTAVYLGTIERPADRGGHSLYCSLVYIDAGGNIGSVHRKLQPTYEERLVWSPGDGNGLRTHAVGPFHAGGLNCWENWMPLPRAVLYAKGENLHVAVWPGNVRNTQDITRFIARESRSYVVSVSARLGRDDIASSLPHGAAIRDAAPEVLADGGSCIAGPDGEWLIEPSPAPQDRLLWAELDLARVLEERQNFDPAGHYSRPDVVRLNFDDRRQSTLDQRLGGGPAADCADR